MLGIDDIRSAVSVVARRYGLGKATLFGSYARGDADATSDVDLVVELTHPLGFARNAVSRELESELGTSVDVVFGAHNLYPFVRAAYELEGVVLYEA